MSGSRKTYYWDTCVYLAWLNEEPRPELSAIKTLLTENRENKSTIITSTLTLVEVLAKKLPPEKEKLFRELFTFEIHTAYDLDIQIAFKARDIRGYYLDLIKPRPSCADAIHLATAIFHQVDIFHTFDDGKKADPDTKEKFSLLGHNGDIAGEVLRIEVPSIDKPPQADFFSGDL
jgi:predicted nucleic acid-binding protein